MLDSGRFKVTGTVALQCETLFSFDRNAKAPTLNVSRDNCTVSVASSGQKPVVFGNVGFSRGLHYWELKIETCDNPAPSVFIGVASKPKAATVMERQPAYNKWVGYGFVNSRASYSNPHPNERVPSERTQVYGECFLTGDTVGVMLDMNRGRLSFFLDGLKFGEHILEDTGEAFDEISGHQGICPRTLFPIVGLARNADRVTITRRWLSTVGGSSADTYQLVRRAWVLLTSWNTHRPSTRPLECNIWAYNEAWLDWRSWRLRKFVRVATRCKVRAGGSLVAVDVRPIACLEASIRLGISYALVSYFPFLFFFVSFLSLFSYMFAFACSVYYSFGALPCPMLLLI